MPPPLHETAEAIRAAIAPMLDGNQGRVFARMDTRTIAIELTPAAARALVESLGRAEVDRTLRLAMEIM